MLGEGGVEWRAEDQAAVALPPLNMNLARYLVIQAIKNKKIRGRSALRPLDIAGLSQLLVQVSNLIVDCPEIQRLDIHPARLRQRVYGAGRYPGACSLQRRQ